MKLISILLISLGVSLAASEKKDSKPNVIVIVADDLGYADVSAYKHAAKDIKTPHIDRLAKRGVTFTQGYVTSPICSASRLGLLTGRYQQRWNAFHYVVRLPEKEITFAEHLRDQGYVTKMVGKNHIYKEPSHPMDFGFDSFYGFNHGTQHFFLHNKEAGKLFKKGNLTAGPMMVDRGFKDEDGYSTTLFEREALDFVDANKDKPFHLYLSFNAVHLFIQVPERDLKAEGLPPFPMWDPKKEPYLKWYYKTLKKRGDDTKNHDPHGRARYRICLRYMDEAIGSLLDRLKKHGIRDNTMIVFLSDNGGSPRTYAINKPLRGYKYNLYEGGIRVPYIISWPEQIKGGQTKHDMISALDVLPTIASAVKAPLKRAVDGVDLLPLMQKDQPLKPRSLFWKRGSQTFSAARHGDWKLIHIKNKGEAERWELYNLKDDPTETKSLHDTHPKQLEKMKHLYLQWEKEVGSEAKK